jgi:membrane complex biogenesis BtpA family protein
MFPRRPAVIGVLHLHALPGAPLYAGSMAEVMEHAASELAIFAECGLDGVIVENFRDMPFHPGRVPAETVAALAAVTRTVVASTAMPVGVNALRSDGESAVAIAAATGAHFVRINVHMGAVVSEQGLIQGASHQVMRLRAALRSDVLVFADVGVKHAAPLADRGLAIEARDLDGRGLADGLIVSGPLTGVETDVADVDIVRASTSLPVLIGSGTTPDNVGTLAPRVDAFIVGSFFKKDGRAMNGVDRARVEQLAGLVARHRG